MRVSLDGKELNADPNLLSWGELLAELETEVLTADRCIWAVRFDGRDLSSFREPEALAASLGSFERVEVESVDGVEQVKSLLAAVPLHLDQLSQVMADAARLYRQNLPRQASARLHAVLSGLEMVWRLLTAAQALRHLPSEGVHHDALPSDNELQALGHVLEDLVRQQESKDFVALARTLDEEIAPRLNVWRRVTRFVAAALEPGNASGVGLSAAPPEPCSPPATEA